MSELLDYTFELSLMGPFRRAESIPVYLNPWELDGVMRAARFLSTYENVRAEKESLPRKLSDDSLRELYRKVEGSLRSYLIDEYGSQEVWEAVLSLALASDFPEGSFLVGQDDRDLIENRFYLPVERFYWSGNVGSGRHVRFGDIELKGSGRNYCSMRSDWAHSWGGLSFDMMRMEILLANQISSVTPIGSVPLLFASLYKQGKGPALKYYLPLELDGSPSDKQNSAYLLFGTIGRLTGYTRLADLYFGPVAPAISIEDLSPMESVIDQYAALIGYSMFDSTPSDDNLTLNGAQLDVINVMKTDSSFPVIAKVFATSRGDLVSPEDFLEELINVNTPFQFMSSSYAQVLAIEAIAKVRKRLGFPGLPTNWKDLYLERIAYHWLLYNGFDSTLAAEHCSVLGENFRSQLDGYELGRDAYVKKCKFELVSAERLGTTGYNVVLSQVIDFEKQVLFSFLDRFADHRSALVAAYNSRKLAPDTMWSKLSELLVGPQKLFDRFNGLLNRGVMLGRFFSSESLEQIQFPLDLRREQSFFVLESDRLQRLRHIFNGPTNFVQVGIRYLKLNGELANQSVSGQWSTNFDSVVFKFDSPAEFIVEGIELELDDSRRQVLPLPLKLWRG